MTMNEEHVVFSYDEKQAIFDGVLVQPMGEKNLRLLMTTALYERLKEVAIKRGVTTDQVVLPLVLDAQLIVLKGQKKDPDETLWTKGLEGNVSGQDVWIAKNGIKGITLMFPSDY